MRIEELALWERYVEGGGVAERNELVEFYLPMVERTAGRLAGRWSSVESGDLVSEGTIGLIESIEKFDFDRGFEFQGFARKRVRGAMVEFVRQGDFIGTFARRREGKLERARLANTDGAGVCDLEAAAESLGLDVATYERWASRVPGALVSLDEEPADDDGDQVLQDHKALPPEGPVLERDLMNWLMRSFDAEDRRLIHLRYYEGMTFGEIAGELGYGQSWVSERHKRLIAAMRSMLKCDRPAAEDRSTLPGVTGYHAG